MKTLLFALVALLPSAATSGTWTQVFGGDWVPDSQTVANLNPGVKEQFERSAESVATSHGWKVPRWESYSFQYQGIKLEGEEVILISAYCRIWSSDYDLAASFMVVKDGGACYFHVFYNPMMKKYFNFHFNGIA